jgi:sulfur carrier protein
MAATIRINGEVAPLETPTLAALLAARAIAPERRGIAIALNGSVVPRAQWDTTALKPGDAIEIVVARQGG